MGAIIVIILIVVIGNMTGLFHFGKPASSSSAASTSTSAEASPTAEASSSSEQAAVPNLLGMTVDEATTACNKLGIGVRQTSTATYEQYDSGQIINQTIAEGTMVDKGTTIDVVVSSGKADVTVPAGLTGSTQADAEASLESAGLVPDIELQYDDTVDVGNVISTSPAEGTSVPSGATVTLYVSKGRDTTNDVKVPDIVGQSKDSALATLDTMGIKYTTQTGSDSSQSNGVVLSVSPDVGATIDKTTDTVTVTINKTATKYVFNTPLSEPDGYNGGKVKLELVQGDKTTTIYEGDDPWTDGPFTTKVESDSGETAVINIYEDGTLIARYPNVTFTEES